MSEQKSVMVIDDSSTIRKILEKELTQAGYRVSLAENGMEALVFLEWADPLPDIITLDIDMPKMDGFEVCEKIKQNPDLKRVMILMVTALNELGDIERAVTAGTDDFLTKPVNKVVLLKKVEIMLKQKNVVDELERLRSYIQEMEER